MTPFSGYRFGGEFDIRHGVTNSQRQLKLDDGPSLGLTLNLDLPEPGKQIELYVARQETNTRLPGDFVTQNRPVPDGVDLTSPDNTRVDLVIYQLQLGGLYFPGEQTTGGFVSGVAGITLMDPKSGDFDSHTRASISLGTGYKVPLGPHLLLRFELRGIYTLLNSGGAVFCSGGCVARFESNGFVQAEAGAGLAFRF